MPSFGSSASPPDCLTIHYRRRLPHYTYWRLWLWHPSSPSEPSRTLLPLTAPPRPPPQSAWGAVFRLPLAGLPAGPVALLPCMPGWRDKDSVAGEAGAERQVAEDLLVGGRHVFVLEGDGEVRESPFAFHLGGVERFVGVLMAGQVREKWLVVKGAGPPREVFGAPRRRAGGGGGRGLVLVDRLQIEEEERFGVRAVGDLEEANDALAWEGVAGILWEVSDGPVVVYEADGGGRGAAVGEAEAVLKLEAEDIRGVGRLEEAVGEPIDGMSEFALANAPRSERPGREDANRVLYVQYRSLVVNREDAPGLVVAGVKYGAVSPPVSAMSDAVCDALGAVAVFRIDMELFDDEELQGGLRLTLVGQQGRTVSASVVWERARDGMSVVLVDRERRLFSAEEASFEIIYYRFDAFEDWSDWELWLWVKLADVVGADGACVGQDGPNAEAAEIKVVAKPRLVDGDASSGGRIAYDLPMAVVLAPDKELRMQPVKLGSVERSAVDSAGDGGDRDNMLNNRVVVKRDISRVLQQRELSDPTGGNGLRDTAYLAQADPRLLFVAPQKEVLQGRRFIEIEYRRYEGDYAGWDLWCWDDTDESLTGHAVASKMKRELSDGKSLSEPAEVKFTIDRAVFGSGSAIHFLPRLGGIKWIQKDEPSRVIPAPDGISDTVESFFTSQAMGFVWKDVREASRYLRAHVEAGEVQISAPVPFEWLVGEGPVTPQVRMLDVPAKDVPSSQWVHLPEKQTLATARVKRACPVSLNFALQAVQNKKDRKKTAAFDIVLDEDFLVENCFVSLPGFDPCPLTWKLYDDWDENLYQGELGWEYSPEQCLFRCFGPTADIVYVVLYESAEGGNGRRVVMRSIPEGCWKAIVPGDLKGKYYKLLAEGRNKRLFPGVEVIDPYSRCNTGHTGRGLIFGTENTPVAPRPNIKPEHTIVYELHLRDATVDPASGVASKGKYLGLTEHGTHLCAKKLVGSSSQSDLGRGGSLTTALDHIIEMGVTAVQIMPIQDFDNDENDPDSYRWGYMPVHFFSPDGWYASKTHSAARVTEVKHLVDVLHKAGLKVILDVVYNHTAEDGNELNLDARFSFNGLAPRYFYRNCLNTPLAHTGESTCARNVSGALSNCGMCVSNGSGCGNEFRSESPMGRKFILDSLKYWVNEYKVDGFRFDLLGLIDLETLTLIAHELHNIDPNIVVYGEPWCGGLTPIKSTEKGMQRSRGFAVFNNSFRDALRGSPFGIEETFVMDGCRLDEVKRGIIGSIDEFTDSPLETINYVECHDNYTLWDHFKFYVDRRTDEISFTDSDLVRMHKLSAAIIFTSQGIPMMQIGQEMCRTKFGEENSYESSDEVNMVRWEGKIANAGVVAYYQGLIALRRAHPELFCLSDQVSIRQRVTFFEDLQLEVPPQCIAYRIKADTAFSEGTMSPGVCEWKEVVVLFNAQPCEVSFVLPENHSQCYWVPVVDATKSGVDAIGMPISGYCEVPGRSAAVLRRASDYENVQALVQIRLNSVTDAFTYPVDEVSSPYAVGLARHRTADEQQLVDDMVRLRHAFHSGSKLHEGKAASTERKG